MAQPIPLDITTHPHQVELVDRLNRAPEEHAAALLAGLELLQLLHDQGILDVLRGAVSAGGPISEQLSKATESKESIRALRNVYLIGKMLSSIDPLVMGRIANAVEETLGPNTPPEPEVPRLMTLIGYFQHKYVRRGLTVVVRFLAALGRQLSPQTS